MNARTILIALLTIGTGSFARAEEPSLYDLLKEPAYKTAFEQMLGGETVDPWIKTFVETGNGVTAASTPMTVEGENDIVAWVCKPHDCGDNQLFVLFSPGAAAAWGMLKVAQAEPKWLGAPSAAAKEALTNAANQQ